jgi:hypothetical protein
MYSSVAPDPEVVVVQPDPKLASAGSVGVWVAMAIALGYADTPEIPLWP